MYLIWIYYGSMMSLIRMYCGFNMYLQTGDEVQQSSGYISNITPHYNTLRNTMQYNTMHNTM